MRVLILCSDQVAASQLSESISRIAPHCEIVGRQSRQQGLSSEAEETQGVDLVIVDCPAGQELDLVSLQGLRRQTKAWMVVIGRDCRCPCSAFRLVHSWLGPILGPGRGM